MMSPLSADHGGHIKARYIAFILMIDLLWAINMVAIKESVAVIPPLLAVALRYAVLLVACALHLRIVPGRMRLLKRPARAAVVICPAKNGAIRRSMP